MRIQPAAIALQDVHQQQFRGEHCGWNLSRFEVSDTFCECAAKRRSRGCQPRV